MTRIKKDYAWAIYDLAEKLYDDVFEYVKSQGGFIDCQEGVLGSADVIYGFNCYGGYDGSSVEEQYVYALKIHGDDMFACLVPCQGYVKERWSREDLDEAFRDTNDIYWNDISRSSDSVLFVPTILNIAEVIEEYGNE